MAFIFILFFGSLIGITIMIGRKLVLLQNGKISLEQISPHEGAPYLEEWKEFVASGAKKYSFIALVACIRLYVRLTNFFKEAYRELKSEIRSLWQKRNERVTEKNEVNKFLKKVSEYKQKIGKIKHQISEEEKDS